MPRQWLVRIRKLRVLLDTRLQMTYRTTGTGKTTRHGDNVSARSCGSSSARPRASRCAAPHPCRPREPWEAAANSSRFQNKKKKENISLVFTPIFFGEEFDSPFVHVGGCSTRPCAASHNCFFSAWQTSRHDASTLRAANRSGQGPRERPRHADGEDIQERHPSSRAT